MRTQGFGLLMMLLTGALACGVALFVVAQLLRARRPPFGRVALGAGLWAMAYVGLLFGTSLTSEERVLGSGEDKRFCGFYLDCHMSVGVVSVERLDRIGPVKPEGVFHVVTLRIGSDAVRATLRLWDPRVVVEAEDGRRTFTRSDAGEAALARLHEPQPPLTEEVGPGGWYTTAVVFDVPRDAQGPQLRVTDGFWAERLVELFLIGDEDSLLHRKVSWRLAA